MHGGACLRHDYLGPVPIAGRRSRDRRAGAVSVWGQCGGDGGVGSARGMCWAVQVQGAPEVPPGQVAPAA